MPGAVHQTRAADVQTDEEHEHEGEEGGAMEGLSQGLLARGGGSPLPDPVRSKMERSFNTDFADVRVHQGPEAGAMGAQAFAHGSDLHFAPGQYDPGSQHGQELLGHELAHVVQQRGGRASGAQGKGADLGGSSSLEREADVAGAAAARGQPAQVSGKGSGVQFKGKKPVSRAFLDAVRDVEAPKIARIHLAELAQRVASKAELRINNTEDGKLIQDLEQAAEDKVKEIATQELAGKQKSDVEALSKKIAQRDQAVKTVVSAKARAIATEVSQSGGYLAAFEAAARAAFDTTTVSKISINKLVIAQATASAKLAVNRLDEPEYQKAKLALDTKLNTDQVRIKNELTTESKDKVAGRALAATGKRKNLDAKVTTIASEAEKPVFDALHEEVEKYLANGLGANGAGFFRSDQLKEFRAQMKKSARKQAKEDVDTDMGGRTGLGKAQKRFVGMDAKLEVYDEAKESVNTHLAEVATQMTDKVLLDKLVADKILDAARQAAFSVYEDEGHMAAAKAAAAKAAKAKSKDLHDDVLAEAKTRKNAIVKTKTDVTGRQDIETGVVQQVKDDEVGKRSVDAAIKGSSPEDGMSKLGHFFDFMAPERGDTIKFKVSVEVPAGPGNVLLELQGDLERGTRERLIEHQPGGGKTISRDTNSLKLGVEIRVGYSGSFPGIKVQGALGFFMRSDAASTDMCMKGLSYGIYRFLTTALPPLANLWGGSQKKAKAMSEVDPTTPDDNLGDEVYRSELWAAMIEEQVFMKDKEARVDLGTSLSGTGEVNGGVVKGKAGLRLELMRTYDHQALKKSIQKYNTKKGTQDVKLGDDQFDKQGAKDRRDAISGRTTGGFVLEAEAEANIAGQKFVFGLKLKITPPDWELEISGGLKLSSSDPADAKVRMIAGIASASQNGLRTLIGIIRNIIDKDHAQAGVLGNVVDGLTSSLSDINNMTNNAMGAPLTSSLQVGTGKEDGVNQTVNHMLGGTTKPDDTTKAGLNHETTYKVAVIFGNVKQFMVKVDEVQNTKLGIKPGGVGLTVEYEKSRRVGQIGVSGGKFHGEFGGVSTRT